MLGLFVKSLGLVLFIFLKHLNELREICHILVEPFGKNTLCCLFAVASAKDDFMESLSRYLWPPNRKCNGINHGNINTRIINIIVYKHPSANRNMASVSSASSSKCLGIWNLLILTVCF